MDSLSTILTSVGGIILGFVLKALWDRQKQKENTKKANSVLLSELQQLLPRIMELSDLGDLDSKKFIKHSVPNLEHIFKMNLLTHLKEKHCEAVVKIKGNLERAKERKDFIIEYMPNNLNTENVADGAVDLLTFKMHLKKDVDRINSLIDSLKKN